MMTPWRPDAGVAVGHVAGALFVHHRDQRDAGRREDVHRVHEGRTHDAEHGVHALRDHGLDEGFGRGHLRQALHHGAGVEGGGGVHGGVSPAWRSGSNSGHSGRFRISGRCVPDYCHVLPQKASIAAMKRDAAAAHAPSVDSGQGAESPTLRLFALLETHCGARPACISLQSLVEDTGLAQAQRAPHAAAARKPAACCSAKATGRHYGTGVRLRRLAENLLLNSSLHGARHACCARWSTNSARAATSPPSSVARWSTSTASRPPRRCASTCTRARACRRTARPAASCSCRR
jgi:hypothetical protein